jgi:hypothetical protein
MGNPESKKKTVLFLETLLIAHKKIPSKLGTFLVTPEGFKPSTSTAVMWCTIQLCYGAFSLL